MNDIDKKLDEIFSELDFAYQYKISDYAISEEQEIEFEKQGLKEVANAKQKIKQLIMDITTEAKIDELTAVINKQVSSESEKEFCDWLNSRRYRLAQPLSKQDDN